MMQCGHNVRHRNDQGGCDACRAVLPPTPRWTPGSLAAAVADWQSEGPERTHQADAVQRLTVEARAVLDSDLPNGAARERLRAAVEAAEKWGTIKG